MIYGWDISTSFIGFTVLTDGGKFVETSHFDFKKIKAKSLHDKMDESQWWIEDCLSKYISGSHIHYFEDRLGNFMAGRTMMQTLTMLASFNTLFSYEVKRIHLEMGERAKQVGDNSMVGVGSIHLHPSSVKAIMKRDGLIIDKKDDKKKKTLEFVSRTVKGFEVFSNKNGNPLPWNYDRADSYITARAGYLRKYVGTDATRKKTPNIKESSEAAGTVFRE